mgnify:CR=1 FL=1
MIRAVAGLGILKHHTVAIVSLTADDGHAVVISNIHVQIFLVDLCHLFHRHDSLAVYNVHVQGLFQIAINGVLRDFFCETGNSPFSGAESTAFCG